MIGTNTTPFTKGRTTALKLKWDRLQGQEHGVDFERARLLHEVFVRYDRNEEQIVSFMIAVLGEYPGKRPLMFLRYVQAFDRVPVAEQWAAVGGKTMVMLSRLNGHKRRSVMTRVQKTLAKTGRLTISGSTFRIIVQEVLTTEEYQGILSEQRVTPTGGSVRQQLTTLRGFILALLRTNPDLRREMPRDVKALLGTDLFE